MSQMGIIMGKKGFSLSFIHEEEQAVRPPQCTVHTCLSVMSYVLFVLWPIRFFQFLVFRYGRTMVLENKVSQLGFSKSPCTFGKFRTVAKFVIACSAGNYFIGRRTIFFDIILFQHTFLRRRREKMHTHATI